MNRIDLRVVALLAALMFGVEARAEAPAARPEAAIEKSANLAYKGGEALSDYETERCHLDLYVPKQKTGFASLVWLHGGGLTGGNKEDKTTLAIARTFADAGIAVAVVNYRLGPKAVFPAYVEDAAASFAWVRGHIAERGGDPKRAFLGGHSAGAYLTSMVGMDTRYLRRLGLEPEAIAGLIPISGQMMTHFNVRKERGLAENTVTADEAAPIYFSRKETPRFLILLGDHDWPARLEENQYFAAFQRTLGNKQVLLKVIPDRTHGSIAERIAMPEDPAALEIIRFIQTQPEKEPEAK